MRKDLKEMEYYVDLTCYNYEGGSPNNLSNGNEGKIIGSFNNYEEAKIKFDSLVDNKDLKEDIKDRGWYAYAVSLSNENENIINEIIYVDEEEEEE